MADSAITLQDWLDVAVKGMEETAVCALGYENLKVSDATNKISENMAGSFISLIGPGVSIQLGITATNETCMLLAKALLGMESDEEDLPPLYVADAVGEIANIVIGIMKTLMEERVPQMQIGLPMFIEGSLTLSDKQKLASVEIEMNSISANITIITPNYGEKEGDV